MEFWKKQAYIYDRNSTSLGRHITFANIKDVEVKFNLGNYT